MGRFIQLVMGPAGVGKSTFCKIIQEHCRLCHRTIHVGNLDPAAENFQYESSFDIKDLINLDEVMNDLGYGPNGGLVYCMEYLLQNIEWLHDELNNYVDDDYIIIDCPGQIELYSHLPIMHTLVNQLVSWGFQVVSVYLLDALFILDPSKFISGCMLSLSCMLQLEIPHINVITKCDIADKDHLNAILDSEGSWVVNAMDNQSSNKFKKLTQAISSVVDDYMIVSFVMLDVSEEDSIEDVLARIDQAIQYGEDIEPKEPVDFDIADDHNN
mmetsp:Transcript_8741/g.7821  ORF Transcript_8741/g.7821 Transcript_8741/m.7821 type:complete len:270 (+) Transcript_8741:39-848(+)